MSSQLLGSGFGRTDFSRIFIFGPPFFFADFLAGFYLLIFVGKSAQKNPPGKSPRKSSKIYTTKILRHISAEWPGQQLQQINSPELILSVELGGSEPLSSLLSLPAPQNSMSTKNCHFTNSESEISQQKKLWPNYFPKNVISNSTINFLELILT